MNQTTTMTATTLSFETIEWYKSASSKVAAFGLLNVFEDRDDRNLYRAVEKELNAAKPAPKTKTKTNKKPVEIKLHYLWTEHDAKILRTLVETGPDEVSALVIFKEEVCRALSKFQPTLSMLDTTKRAAFAPLQYLLMEDAAAIGRVANLDRDAWTAATAAKFPDNWNQKWATNRSTCPAPLGAVIPSSAADSYREKVREEVERMTLEVYPSLA